MTAFCGYAIQAIAMVTLSAWNGPASADEQYLWRALTTPGHVAIMRHALTDTFPASGEIVVLRRTGQGRLAVLGTIETD